MPSWTRPPDSASSVATDLASTAGWCSGTITTFVPRLIVVVCEATNASHMSGSGIPPRRHSRSIFPSSDPGTAWRPRPPATTTCSGHHSDSNPAASAAVAMATRGQAPGNEVLAKTMPHFMLSSPSRFLRNELRLCSAFVLVMDTITEPVMHTITTVRLCRVTR